MPPLATIPSCACSCLDNRACCVLHSVNSLSGFNYPDKDKSLILDHFIRPPTLLQKEAGTRGQSLIV